MIYYTEKVKYANPMFEVEELVIAESYKGEVKDIILSKIESGEITKLPTEVEVRATDKTGRKPKNFVVFINSFLLPEDKQAVFDKLREKGFEKLAHYTCYDCSYEWVEDNFCNVLCPKCGSANIDFLGEL